MTTHLVIPDGYEVRADGSIMGLRGSALKPWKTAAGYLDVDLGAAFRSSVHRLVASVHVPNPKGKPQVNHIDGNKHNNASSNLEWVTPSENMAHASNNGLCAGFYGKQKLAPTPELDNKIERLFADLGTSKAVAKQLGCSFSAVCRYVKQRNLQIEYRKQ